jgi:hypothetical protein
MRCHEARHRLDPFMDGEISVEENLRVLEHLNLCRACAGAFEGEKALRAVLRRTLGASDAAPAGLEERLAAALASPAPATTRTPLRTRFRWGSLAAAAALALAVLTLVFSHPGRMPRAVASDLSERHDATRLGFCGQSARDCVCFCSDCNEDGEAALAPFFRRHVDYDVCTHPIEGMGYRFVGASVWDHEGRAVCWTIQRDDRGRTITHGLVATPIAMGTRPVFLPDAASHPVIMTPSCQPGMTCVFVFDDAAEAERFRKAAKMY